jgi:hypothetical protein
MIYFTIKPQTHRAGTGDLELCAATSCGFSKKNKKSDQLP